MSKGKINASNLFFQSGANAKIILATTHGVSISAYELLSVSTVSYAISGLCFDCCYFLFNNKFKIMPENWPTCCICMEKHVFFQNIHESCFGGVKCIEKLRVCVPNEVINQLLNNCQFVVLNQLKSSYKIEGLIFDCQEHQYYIILYYNNSVNIIN